MKSKISQWLSVLGVGLLQVQTFPMIYYALVDGRLVAWETSTIAIIGVTLLTLRQLHDKVLVTANIFYIACHTVLLLTWII
jgi:hypothetical protein